MRIQDRVIRRLSVDLADALKVRPRLVVGVERNDQDDSSVLALESSHKTMPTAINPLKVEYTRPGKAKRLDRTLE